MDFIRKCSEMLDMPMDQSELVRDHVLTSLSADVRRLVDIFQTILCSSESLVNTGAFYRMGGIVFMN